MPMASFAGPLEVIVLNKSQIMLSNAVSPLIYMAILIILIPVILRVILSNLDFKSIGPLVIIVVVALILLLAFFATQYPEMLRNSVQEMSK